MMIKRFPDGTAKPFLTPHEYAQLRDDDRFLYNEGPPPSARITGDKDRENPVEGAHTAPSGDVERAVMVCPQCEGEGGYPDGMDEAACHTECTRCGSNGWIVNQAAIAAMRPARGVELAETGAVIRLTPRLLLDRMLPSGAGLDDAPDSKIVAMYLSLGELRGLRGLIAALRQAGEG